MKMRPEHLKTMRDAINAQFTYGMYQGKTAAEWMAHYKTYEIGKDHRKRLAWDLLTIAQIDGCSTTWICGTLYVYLNDTHIDTALRSILSDLLAA